MHTLPLTTSKAQLQPVLQHEKNQECDDRAAWYKNCDQAMDEVNFIPCGRRNVGDLAGGSGTHWRYPCNSPSREFNYKKLLTQTIMFCRILYSAVLYIFTF